jgi:hypothetical protein
VSGQIAPLGRSFSTSPQGGEAAPSISAVIPLPIRIFRLFDGEPEMADGFFILLINMVDWR